MIGTERRSVSVETEKKPSWGFMGRSTKIKHLVGKKNDRSIRGNQGRSTKIERFEEKKCVRSMNTSGGECADEGHQEFCFCLSPSPCHFSWRSPKIKPYHSIANKALVASISPRSSRSFCDSGTPPSSSSSVLSSVSSPGLS